LAENDAAAKLKARLNQWQEYVEEVQERPSRAGLDPAAVVSELRTPYTHVRDGFGHAVVPSIELSPEKTPSEQSAGAPPIPAAAAISPVSAPPAAASGPSAPTRDEPTLAAPMRSNGGPSRQPADDLIEILTDSISAGRIDTLRGDAMYDSLLESTLSGYHGHHGAAAGRKNGHSATSAAHAGPDPRTRRIQQDREHRENAQRQVNYARRINAILSVCVILLIALISCLVTFVLDR
jgi:hypothetical protein